jgi:threonylcarbamoyladenosine tRNA methylthiotransferase MtaB
VFTYSERDNTPASEMQNSVAMHERKKRTNMLRILSAKKLRFFYETQKDKIYNVLFESDNKNGFMHGFTENYVKVKTEYHSELTNNIYKCRLNSIDETGEMTCEMISFDFA